jgi:hypothetical protein
MDEGETPAGGRAVVVVVVVVPGRGRRREEPLALLTWTPGLRVCSSWPRAAQFDLDKYVTS